MQQTIPDTRYQWIKGDKQGNVEDVSGEEDGFLIFQSGSRINKELINEFMMPITHDSQLVNPADGLGEDYQQQVQASTIIGGAPGMGVSSVNFSDAADGDNNITLDEHGQPQKTTAQILAEQKVTPQKRPINVPNNITAPPAPKVEINPIKMLLNQSTKDNITADIKLEIKLPKPAVYSLIKDSFEDVDVDQEILDIVLSAINNTELQEQVKQQLTELINSHYK